MSGPGVELQQVLFAPAIRYRYRLQTVRLPQFPTVQTVNPTVHLFGFLYGVPKHPKRWPAGDPPFPG